MEKGYEAFVEALRQALLVASGLEESKIYFEKKGGKYSAKGDRLFVEFAGYEDGKEVCALYTGELYERYRQEQGMEEIVGDVVNELNRVRGSGIFEKTRNISQYDKVRKDLFIRLLNVNRCHDDLGQAIYRTIGDIALVLYMKVGEDDGCITSVKIRQEHIDRWGMACDKVFDDALLNTYFMTPPRIYRWEKLIYNPEYDGENFMDLLSGFVINKDAVGNCLSTTRRTNGAVAVFLPGVARRLGDLLGEDFYMVFTSIHEVMIHNDRKVEPDELIDVLEDTIKEATPAEDFLSARIYHYCRESGEFTCVE